MRGRRSPSDGPSTLVADRRRPTEVRRGTSARTTTQSRPDGDLSDQEGHLTRNPRPPGKSQVRVILHRCNAIHYCRSAKPMTSERVTTLLTSLGIDADSFEELVEWVLCERLVRELGQGSDLDEMLGKPRELRVFRSYVEKRTGRRWSIEDLKRILARIKADRTRTARHPIRTEEAMLLKLSAPFVCAECKREPPEVTLHMDHIIPASRGGSSKAENLQWLCQRHNLEKSDKRRPEGPWLELT